MHTLAGLYEEGEIGTLLVEDANTAPNLGYEALGLSPNVIHTHGKRTDTTPEAHSFVKEDFLLPDDLAVVKDRDHGGHFPRCTRRRRDPYVELSRLS